MGVLAPSAVRWAWAATLVGWLCPGLAAAEEPPWRSLVYSAPVTCPAEDDFVRRVQGRLGGSAKNDGSAEPVRALSVHIVQSEGHYTGRVVLTGADGSSTSKALVAQKCDDLVDALSLVCALAVRPEVSEAPEAAPQAAPADQPPPPPIAAPAPPAPPVVRSPEPSPSEVPVRSLLGTRLHVQLGALVAGGPAPLPIVGGMLGVGWALERAGVLSPAVTLGFAAGAAPVASETLGRASFSWFVARAAACAVRLSAAGGWIRVRGCFSADVGLLDATGEGTVAPESSSRGWLSLGASSELEVPVGSRFGVHAVAGVEAPLRRDRFAFGAEDFFQVPFAIWTGSVALAAYVLP